MLPGLSRVSGFFRAQTPVVDRNPRFLFFCNALPAIPGVATDE
jgi:hypothetical protein